MNVDTGTTVFFVIPCTKLHVRNAEVQLNAKNAIKFNINHWSVIRARLLESGAAEMNIFHYSLAPKVVVLINGCPLKTSQ